MKLRRLHKKAASLDNFYIMIQIFAFGIFILVMFKLWGIVSGMSLFTDTTQGTQVKNSAQVVFDNLDFFCLMVFFALHLGILILAYFLRTHPVVMVASILLVIILVIISVPLSNTWETLHGDITLGTYVGNIPKFDFIMLHLPMFELVFGFLTAFVLAGFSRTEGYI